MNRDSVNNKTWHVVYTRSRSEKKVYAGLLSQNIDCFLPLQRKLRQWKDRKKWVKMPIISGYCFVRIDQKEYEKVLQTNHVVCYVKFEGRAARIPQEQIEFLKSLTAQSEFEIEVSRQTFGPGKKVEIISGPLMGLRGELISFKGKNRFILRIEQINTVFSVEVPAENLTLLPLTEQ